MLWHAVDDLGKVVIVGAHTPFTLVDTHAYSGTTGLPKVRPTYPSRCATLRC